MKRITLLVLVAAMVAAMAVSGAASAHPGHDEDPKGGPAEKLDARTKKKLVEVRRATAKYRDVNRALEDGYIATETCVESPDGGMGYHYINPELASDAEVRSRKPDILLYEPKKNGKLELAGVEWFVADEDQDTATDDDRPYLFGKVPFDGPMEGHELGMPVHYDLHAWIFEHNPSGTFAPFNPRVDC